MSNEQAIFRPATFAFLRDLREHNDREWFQANKSRYTQHVLEPALEFVRSFAPELQRISPHFQAVAKPVGGSLLRIYRDTRFRRDKTPYNTSVSMSFRHESAASPHSPAFYLHLEPGDCFVGVGIWRPDTATARQIRQSIAADPSAWKRAVGAKFSAAYELGGESYKRPPADIDARHPLIADLSRKSFVGMAPLTQGSVTSAAFVGEFARMCRSGAPLVRFLCEALGTPF